MKFKQLLVFCIAAITLFSCSDNAAESEALPLTSLKQQISYLIGADHAQQIIKDPNFSKYNKEELVKGFEVGLANPKAYDQMCEAELQKLYAPGNNVMDESHTKTASNCIGKLLGSVFNSGWERAQSIKEFDLKYVRYGFELALNKKDTLLPETTKQKCIGDFMAKVNQRITVQVEQRENAYFTKVKQIKGIQVLPQGLYLETIKAGSGGTPTIAEDVKAHYVLMNHEGDTIQSSLVNPTVPVFNLSGVIPGWTVGFPYMKKGGKYKLYVPQAMGYGAQSPDQSIPPFSTLVFYIDFIDFGKSGTLK